MHQNRRLAAREPHIRKPGSIHPFKRINALIDQYNMAAARLDQANRVANNPPHGMDLTLIHAEQLKAKAAFNLSAAALFGYKSRGRGERRGRDTQRSCFSRALQDRSIYAPWDCDQRHYDVSLAERAVLKNETLRGVWR